MPVRKLIRSASTRLAHAVCLLLVSAVMAAAQTSPQITGRVLDPSGAIVPGATLTLTGTAAGSRARTATATGAGQFRFDSVATASRCS